MFDFRNFSKPQGGRLLPLSLLLALSLTLAGCGSGGGGGTSSSSDDTTTTTFAGSVTAPDGTTTASVDDFDASDILLAVFQIGDARAVACTGLCPWSGVDVALRRLKADGSLGETLATATTDSNGEYQFDVDDVSPASDLVVVADDGSNQLKAPAATDAVDVDPMSHFIANKIKTKLANNLDISEFSPAEINAMVLVVREIVNEAVANGDVDFTNKTLSEADDAISTTDDKADDGQANDSGGTSSDLIDNAESDTSVAVADGYNLLMLGLHMGTDGDQVEFDQSGIRLHGSVSQDSSTGDHTLGITEGHELYQESSWYMDFTNNSVSSKEHSATAETLGNTAIGPFYASLDGRLLISGGDMEALGGSISSDGERLAFTGYEAGGGDHWFFAGAAKWDTSSLTGSWDYNLVGLSFVAKGDTQPKWNGKVGSRVRWGEVATLDADNKELTYSMTHTEQRRRAITAPIDTGIDIFQTDKQSDDKDLEIADDGRIYKLQSDGSPAATPFAVLAPHADMLLTLGRKQMDQDGIARTRLRIGLPVGSSCDKTTFSGVYRLQYMNQGFSPRDDSIEVNDFNARSNIGYMAMEADGDGNFTAPSDHFREVDVVVGTDESGTSTSVTQETGSGWSGSVSVNNDCTFTIGSTGHGIISPDGDTVAFIDHTEDMTGDGTATPSGDGNDYAIAFGFRDDS